MSAIVTKGLIYEYVIQNPYSTPNQIAKNLDVPVNAVNKRLLKLLYNGVIDRREEKPRMDYMFYYQKQR
jgi:predicted transcriptional regulator